MVWYRKVVWSEGMFLRAQHFQQNDRYMERFVRGSVAALHPYPWGVSDLKINHDLLALGRFGLSRLSGILLDGTPFDCPDIEDLPPPLEIPRETRNCVVYLALPLRQAGGVEVAEGADNETPARFSSELADVADNTAATIAPAHIALGHMRLRMVLETEPRDGFACIGLARIQEVQANNMVVLDEAFIPPALDCARSPALANFMTNLSGLLQQRGDVLATRLGGGRGAAESADFLMLQTVNRNQALLNAMAGAALHPFDFYRFAAGLAGELATYGVRSRRPDPLSPYRHDDLQHSFAPVMAVLREALSSVLEQTVVPIPLEDRGQGMRVGVVPDKTLFDRATFVLSVTADMQGEALRKTFPPQSKIGPVERIRELINSALRGIPVNPMAVAPPQIPYFTGVVYFQLERGHPMWKELVNSGGIAIHVSGSFPGMNMTLWAILE